MALASASPAHPVPVEATGRRAFHPGLLLLLAGAVWWLVYSAMIATAVAKA
jgi:hypothetical protein